MDYNIEIKQLLFPLSVKSRNEPVHISVIIKFV